MCRRLVQLAATLVALTCVVGCPSSNKTVTLMVIDQSSGQSVPIPGAAVTLTDATGGSAQSGTTDANGTVSLVRLAPSPDTATASFGDGSYDPSSVIVQRGETQATITLTPNKPHLFVSVNNPSGLNGSPQVGAAVTITPSDGSAVITGTTLGSNFNGSTVTSVLNGLFGPVVVTPGVTYAVSVVGKDNASTARGSVTFPPSGTASQVLALNLLPSAVLTVVVSDPSNKPLAGATVAVSQVVNQTNVLFASGTTDKTGTAPFLLPLGLTYSVTASLPGFVNDTQQITFTQAQSLTHTLLPAGPNLIVTVVNANRAPVPNATVGIFLFGASGSPGPLVYTGTTGATGVAGFIVDTARPYQAGAALGGPPKAPDPNSPVIFFPPIPQQVTLVLPNAPAAHRGGKRGGSPARPAAPTPPAAGAQAAPSRGKVLPAPGR